MINANPTVMMITSRQHPLVKEFRELALCFFCPASGGARALMVAAR